MADEEGPQAPPVDQIPPADQNPQGPTPNQNL